jgi:glycosyltransferase involved in cell wall biosynthesis
MHRALLVTNLATHYRRPLYLRLAETLDMQFVFYSDGGEWYWNADDSGIEGLPARRLRGFWAAGTRITPGLVPIMLRERYDVCIGSLNGKFALPVSYLGARLRRKPFVLWAGMWRHPDSRIHRFTRRPTRYLYRNADAVLTYGRHVSRFVVEEGADAARVWEAPQAVDQERFTPGDRGGRADGPLRIAYVGRLEEWKGPMVLLRALAATQVPFVASLAGEGPQRADLEAFIASNGLGDRVRLVGQVPNEELPSFYRDQDVVVVPSVETAGFAEPWSLVVNEAMGCGCLVMASDAVGAAADGLVDDERTGRVFPAGDANALAGLLTQVALDPAGAERMQQAGQDAVRAYSFEAAADAFGRAVAFAVARHAARRGAR